MSDTSPLLIDLPEEILGPRVKLRPYLREDAEQMYEAVRESRERLDPWLPWAKNYTSLDFAKEYVVRARAQFMLREDLPLGIFDHETSRLLGGTGLHRVNWDIRAFEIGYWLRTSAEGKGYMQEAVRELTKAAFELLDANRVEIRMDPQNSRSQNVAERLGYVFEGTLRNRLPGTNGEPRDTHVYSLVPEDYRKLQWAGKVETVDE